MVLVDKVLEDMGKGPMDQIDDREFRSVVCEIYQRISLLGRWTGGGVWGSEFAEDEELMRRLGDIYMSDYSLAWSIFMLKSQMSFGTPLSSWPRKVPPTADMVKLCLPFGRTPAATTTSTTMWGYLIIIIIIEIVVIMITDSTDGTDSQLEKSDSLAFMISLTDKLPTTSSHTDNGRGGCLW